MLVAHTKLEHHRRHFFLNISISTDLQIEGDENSVAESHSFSSDADQSRRSTNDLKNKCSNKITESNNPPSSITVRKEYNFPIKNIFLIKQSKLQQRLRNSGVEVSFTFPTINDGSSGKLIVETTAESQKLVLNKLAYMMNVIDDCDGLSKSVCRYLACKSEIRAAINQKLQNQDVIAGVTFIDQSVSVVALNPDVHKEAIALLQRVIVSHFTTININNLCLLQDMDTFLFEVKDSIPHFNRIILESDLDQESSTWIMTATGPRELVYIILDKEQDYKVINASIKNISALKTEYLRVCRMDDIVTLEKKHGCQIEIEIVAKSEIFTPQLLKTIKIKCCRLNKDKVYCQIQEMIDGVMIEQEVSISLYSRIGRFHQCNTSNSKLERLQKECKCLVVKREHQDRRYHINAAVCFEIEVAVCDCFI